MFENLHAIYDDYLGEREGFAQGRNVGENKNSLLFNFFIVFCISQIFYIHLLFFKFKWTVENRNIFLLLVS